MSLTVDPLLSNDFESSQPQINKLTALDSKVNSQLNSEQKLIFSRHKFDSKQDSAEGIQLGPKSKRSRRETNNEERQLKKERRASRLKSKNKQQKGYVLKSYEYQGELSNDEEIINAVRDTVDRSSGIIVIDGDRLQKQKKRYEQILQKFRRKDVNAVLQTLLHDKYQSDQNLLTESSQNPDMNKIYKEYQQGAGIENKGAHYIDEADLIDMKDNNHQTDNLINFDNDSQQKGDMQIDQYTNYSRNQNDGRGQNLQDYMKDTYYQDNNQSDLLQLQSMNRSRDMSDVFAQSNSNRGFQQDYSQSSQQQGTTKDRDIDLGVDRQIDQPNQTYYIDPAVQQQQQQQQQRQGEVSYHNQANLDSVQKNYQHQQQNNQYPSFTPHDLPQATQQQDLLPHHNKQISAQDPAMYPTFENQNQQQQYHMQAQDSRSKYLEDTHLGTITEDQRSQYSGQEFLNSEQTEQHSGQDKQQSGRDLQYSGRNLQNSGQDLQSSNGVRTSAQDLGVSNPVHGNQAGAQSQDQQQYKGGSRDISVQNLQQQQPSDQQQQIQPLPNSQQYHQVVEKLKEMEQQDEIIASIKPQFHRSDKDYVAAISAQQGVLPSTTSTQKDQLPSSMGITPHDIISQIKQSQDYIDQDQKNQKYKSQEQTNPEDEQQRRLEAISTHNNSQSPHTQKEFQHQMGVQTPSSQDRGQSGELQAQSREANIQDSISRMQEQYNMNENLNQSREPQAHFVIRNRHEKDIDMFPGKDRSVGALSSSNSQILIELASNDTLNRPSDPISKYEGSQYPKSMGSNLYQDISDVTQKTSQPQSPLGDTDGRLGSEWAGIRNLTPLSDDLSRQGYHTLSPQQLGLQNSLSNSASSYYQLKDSSNSKFTDVQRRPSQRLVDHIFNEDDTYKLSLIEERSKEYSSANNTLQQDPRTDKQIQIQISNSQNNKSANSSRTEPGFLNKEISLTNFPSGASRGGDRDQELAQLRHVDGQEGHVMGHLLPSNRDILGDVDQKKTETTVTNDEMVGLQKEDIISDEYPNLDVQKEPYNHLTFHDTQDPNISFQALDHGHGAWRSAQEDTSNNAQKNLVISTESVDNSNLTDQSQDNKKRATGESKKDIQAEVEDDLQSGKHLSQLRQDRNIPGLFVHSPNLGSPEEQKSKDFKVQAGQQNNSNPQLRKDGQEQTDSGQKPLNQEGNSGLENQGQGIYNQRKERSRELDPLKMSETPRLDNLTPLNPRRDSQDGKVTASFDSASHTFKSSQLSVRHDRAKNFRDNPPSRLIQGALDDESSQGSQHKNQQNNLQVTNGGIKSPPSSLSPPLSTSASPRKSLPKRFSYNHNPQANHGNWSPPQGRSRSLAYEQSLGQDRKQNQDEKQQQRASQNFDPRRSGSIFEPSYFDYSPEKVRTLGAMNLENPMLEQYLMSQTPTRTGVIEVEIEGQNDQANQYLKSKASYQQQNLDQIQKSQNQSPPTRSIFQSVVASIFGETPQEEQQQQEVQQPQQIHQQQQQQQQQQEQQQQEDKSTPSGNSYHNQTKSREIVKDDGLLNNFFMGSMGVIFSSSKSSVSKSTQSPRQLKKLVFLDSLENSSSRQSKARRQGEVLSPVSPLLSIGRNRYRNYDVFVEYNSKEYDSIRENFGRLLSTTTSSQKKQYYDNQIGGGESSQSSKSNYRYNWSNFKDQKPLIAGQMSELKHRENQIKYKNSVYDSQFSTGDQFTKD